MKIFKRILLLLLLSILAAAGYVGYLLMQAESDAIPYRTDTISRGDIANVINATGTIRPEEVITVGTQVSGQITGIYVKLNDEVKKGQLLAEVDPSIAERELKQNKGNLLAIENAYRLSVRDYERTKKLFAKDFVSRVELDQSWQSVINARNSLENAQITVEQFEINLGYTKVTSPIDGVVIAQQVQSGQTLAANFQSPDLFTIAKDMRVMMIDMNMTESDISQVKEGMKVVFTTDAFPERSFIAVVETIILSPDNKGGVTTYKVQLRFENKDRALLPGMTANIIIPLAHKPNVLRVPVSALLFKPPVEKENPLKKLFKTATSDNSQTNNNATPSNVIKSATPRQYGQKTLYTWQDGKLKEHFVNTGITDDVFVEIESKELKEGDVVISGILVKKE